MAKSLTDGVENQLRKNLEEKMHEALYLATFGHFIQELRKEKVLSLAEVSAELRISLNYLSELERGKKAPSDRLIRKIASYYNLSLPPFFSRLGRGVDVLSNLLSARPKAVERLNDLLANLNKLNLSFEVAVEEADILVEDILQLIEKFVNHQKDKYENGI